MDRTYTIDELWAAVRRRWKTMALVAGGVLVLAALVIARIPNEYRARALVMVEPFTPHPDLVIPVVNTLNLEQKVKSVREGVYARSLMATAIEELKLYPKEREKSLDEAVAAFQLCSKLEGIIPALEPAHALARVLDLAPQYHIASVNMSLGADSFEAGKMNRPLADPGRIQAMVDLFAFPFDAVDAFKLQLAAAPTPPVAGWRRSPTPRAACGATGSPCRERRGGSRRQPRTGEWRRQTAC